ncbi:metallopeptidase [Litorimonas cladophorae]|uniref:Metallopeptidase n=1 Tax=Litorimonas cladophorae TaxID=1220491 RepID=A0A918KBJ8_9PROT|nr:Xaa-Pro peptidase family protein [Litorimonas cladophorae]GGX57052.1 metallopeptidase [Litorimonas cladophorae]
MIKVSKREMLIGAGALGLSSLVGCQNPPANTLTPPSLTSLTTNAQPISVAERKSRIAKAQSLMRERGIGALILEAGSSLVYFTGIRWWRSERFTGAVLLADGGPDAFAIITPFFEEPSIRESLTLGDDVRTWHEDESPFKSVVDYLRENNALSKPIAVEETVRNFISTGLKAENAGVDLVSGQPITRGCRMFKSPAELALMQAANDVTMAAYRHIYPQVEVGMTRHNISKMMSDATRALGATVQFSMCLVGPSSSFPHGSDIEYTVKEGEVILMDCGASVHDYESDISRTWVMGEANAQQRKVWNTVKRGQELALETATLGTPAGRVDDVVRTYYTAEGFGPDYAAPGLTHRLGHGIGMDGHEPVNFVRGETTLLAAGMCFSNEPGIYLPGEFGVRLEDCLYMSERGPVLFSPLSKSIDDPFGV